MESIRVISTKMVQAPNQIDHSTKKVHLTPWDLQHLLRAAIQKGLLFHNPNKEDRSVQIQHLKDTFSTTLAFFPPLTGRLSITQHDDNTASCCILCNNAGALFVHAVAENTRVADILEPEYVPPIVHSFFPLNGVRNYQGTSQPLLGVQVTELLDGVFISCTFNHVAVDGESFWHFMNSWAEISRGCQRPSKHPSVERWFFDGIEPPIRFHLKKEDYSESPNPQPLPPPSERYFHFTKEKIAKIKAKANAEAGTSKISSLQALSSHLWRSLIRCNSVDLQEEVTFIFIVGVRSRVVPPLPEGYFGNAVKGSRVIMKAEELIEEGGVGKAAWEMNKIVSLTTGEKVRSQYESWLSNPYISKMSSVFNINSVMPSSSPRFNVYGNDFGWGKPVALRSGNADKSMGKVSVFAGAEEGSIDIELFFPYEILEALANDSEFMDI